INSFSILISCPSVAFNQGIIFVSLPGLADESPLYNFPALMADREEAISGCKADFQFISILRQRLGVSFHHHTAHSVIVLQEILESFVKAVPLENPLNFGGQRFIRN